MQPLRIRRDDATDQIDETEAIPLFTGAVLNLKDVISYDNTILDKKICADGAWIDLPVPCLDWSGRKITRVYVPAFEHRQIGKFVQLHPMATVANRLLKEINDYESGLKTDTMVQGAVSLYFHTALKLVGGKLGLLNTNILGARMKDSGRAVLLINADFSPRYAGIPKTIMRSMDIKNDALVIVGRDPTIWHGSLEVLRARSVPGNAIELHPLLFNQLAGDCDGDEVYVYKVPDTPECQAEAEAQILRFTKDHAKWPAFMRETDDSDIVNWGSIRVDGKDRSKITGFSVSPREILAADGNVTALCERTGKDVAEECKEIAEGLTKEQVQRYVQDQNVAMLTMKMGMGRVGAMANRLRTISGTNSELMESACYLSECLQQVLLDSKHHVGTSGEGTYSPEDLDKILNRQDEYEFTDLEDVLEIMETIGVERKRAWPILAYIWVVYPTAIGVQILGSELTLARSKRMISYTMHFLSHGNRELMMKKVSMAGKFPIEALESEVKNLRMGLTDICRAHYPIFEFAQDSCMESPKRKIEVAERLFLHKDWDPAGVTRKSLDIAMAQITKTEKGNIDVDSQ